jgi:2-oxoisovalerate dehydrogenase E1 component
VVADRVAIVEANLDRAIDAAAPSPSPLAPDAPLAPGRRITAREAVDVFADQVVSRALDVAARHLKAAGAGYYTISSAGHENNAVVGALLRTTDPAFLHYRSGGFMAARSRQHPGVDFVTDTLLSLAAAADDPIAGGRHKVWGSRPLWVPPQTSTIASHLPKATGAAFAIERARRMEHRLEIPSDSIVCCSFGDASANHASALAGINAARYAHRRGSRVPILFVCEDNGLGISVDTPRRWIQRNFVGLPHLEYIHATGELDEIWDEVAQAVALCRGDRRPVFLHLDTVRLWGHAGSDVEAGYRSAEDIAAGEARDPLVRNAQRLITTGAATPAQLQELVGGIREQVQAAAGKLAGTPPLATRAAVMAPLAPYDRDAAELEAGAAGAEPGRRRALFGATLPEHATVAVRRTMAAHINAALHDELLARPQALVFGEDVARKGGVYNVTSGLQRAFGPDRVFDTLLDETTVLGVAQGAGLLGYLPIPEIQYLAYVHNALDQLRGEAASLSFFSAGQFTNPMVVRIAGLAYQKGFGGHFHNDNSVGALRDIPGLLLAVPARGDDAARMLRGLIATAVACGRVGVFLEPIALYHEKDLYDPGDGGWLTDYPPPGDALFPGEVGIHHAEASDVLVVTYGNGVRMALQAARELAGAGVGARVLDLRWLNPLPLGAVADHAEQCAAVVVADECRATGGGIADAVLAALAERGHRGPLTSARSADSYVPLGPAADTVLLSVSDIVEAVQRVRP